MTEIDRSPADLKLLQILATGSTVTQAALDAGVSESTIYRRLREPEFRHDLNEIKDAILASTVAKLTNTCTAAVDTLKALLDCDSPSTRLGAAKAIIELSATLRTNVDFAERITKLEQRNVTKSE